MACTASASPYMGAYDLLPLTFVAVALLAEGKLDATGRRLAQLVFWMPALQLLFGTCKSRPRIYRAGLRGLSGGKTVRAGRERRTATRPLRGRWLIGG